MNNLGRAYTQGIGGLPKDDAQAVSWFRKAAEAGGADGMINLGWAYSQGHGGLPQDHTQARFTAGLEGRKRGENSARSNLRLLAIAQPNKRKPRSGALR